MKNKWIWIGGGLVLLVVAGAVLYARSKNKEAPENALAPSAGASSGSVMMGTPTFTRFSVDPKANLQIRKDLLPRFR